MNLTVFGANGSTGRLLTGMALTAGHRVVAATRHPDAFPIRHPELRVAAAGRARREHRRRRPAR